MKIPALVLGLAAAMIGALVEVQADPGGGAATFQAPMVSDAAAAGAPRSVVTVERAKDGLEVVGHSWAAASRDAAWSVLTDYDGISRFVSSMRESRVQSRGDGHVLVDQVALGRLLFFKRKLRVTLWVTEEPPGLIRFEDVQRKDFVNYQGEWRIEEHGDRVEIDYRVFVRPAFTIPGMIARGALQRSVRDLLDEVAAEIERRDSLAAH